MARLAAWLVAFVSMLLSAGHPAHVRIHTMYDYYNLTGEYAGHAGCAQYAQSMLTLSGFTHSLHQSSTEMGTASRDDGWAAGYLCLVYPTQTQILGVVVGPTDSGDTNNRARLLVTDQWGSVPEHPSEHHTSFFGTPQNAPLELSWFLQTNGPTISVCNDRAVPALTKSSYTILKDYKSWYFGELVGDAIDYPGGVVCMFDGWTLYYAVSGDYGTATKLREQIHYDFWSQGQSKH